MKKIIVCLALLLALCACDSNSPKAKVVAALQEKRNEMTSEFEKSMGESMDDFFSGDEELANEFYALLKDVDVKIGSQEMNGDYATVSVTITTYDFGKLISNYLQEMMKTLFSSIFAGNEENANKALLQVLRVQIDSVKKEGKTYVKTSLIECSELPLS